MAMSSDIRLMTSGVLVTSAGIAGAALTAPELEVRWRKWGPLTGSWGLDKICAPQSVSARLAYPHVDSLNGKKEEGVHAGDAFHEDISFQYPPCHHHKLKNKP